MAGSTALILGAGGFIGGHLCQQLKDRGYWVRGVDLKHPEFGPSPADEFIVGDLRDRSLAMASFDRHFDEVYQLAADMGGAGYIFTGDNDAEIMHSSAAINLNALEGARASRPGCYFFSSSACIYPKRNQVDPEAPTTEEGSAYPAAPDSEYGWEKLFSERLCLSFERNYGLSVRVARFHNVFGPEGTWTGGREKAPAAICRKVAEARDGSEIELWGDGLQTRSFLFIDECLEAVRRFLDSDFSGPLNIGSSEMVTIRDLAQMVISISGKTLRIVHTPGPQGVRGRTSDNRLIDEKLGWRPTRPLRDGLEKTYAWIEAQARAAAQKEEAAGA